MKNKSSKIFTIIQHEYISKVKSRGFILGTILAPLGIVLIYGAIIAVSVMSSGQTNKKIAVLDLTGQIGAELVQRDTAKFFLTTESTETLNKKIIDGSLDGYMVIDNNFLQTGNIDVFTSGGGGLGFVSSIENNAEDIVVNKKLKEIGADDTIIDLVNRGVSVNTKKVTEEGAKEDFSQVLAFLGYALGFMIYGLMFTYGSFVMRGVIEEKANRIVEVIASSARPFEIMFGKVVGIGAVGLTQVLFWLILLIILFASGSSIISLFIDKPDAAMMAQGMGSQPEQMELIKFFDNFSISPWIIVAFIFYFLSGYFIYSSLFAAVGSAVDQEQDASQLTLPISLPIIIPIMFISNVMANPDGALSVTLSLIPFFTPILMIARIAASDVPLWQILLSVVLLALTFLLCLWVASKIYRVGILMYGKKPTFKDLIKWFRLG